LILESSILLSQTRQYIGEFGHALLPGLQDLKFLNIMLRFVSKSLGKMFHILQTGAGPGTR